MADILSLSEARARREADQAKSKKTVVVSQKFDEALTHALSVWEFTVKNSDDRARDEQIKALVNLYLERAQLKVQDVWLDEASRVEQALKLKLMIHYPGSIVSPNFTNSGFSVITIGDKGMWSTPPFTAERYARWFNVILYFELLEAGLA